MHTALSALTRHCSAVHPCYTTVVIHAHVSIVVASALSTVWHAVMQLEMAQAGISLFVEKPLSLRPAAEVAQLAHELKHLQEQNKYVSVCVLLLSCCCCCTCWGT